MATRLLVVLLFLFNIPVALAYIGPGSGLSAIGSLVAIVGTFLLIIVGFFWYPLKRLYSYLKRKLQKEKLEVEASGEKESTDDPS